MRKMKGEKGKAKKIREHEATGAGRGLSSHQRMELVFKGIAHLPDVEE